MNKKLIYKSLRMFARAGQPELVRSNQKDVYYLGFLREGVGQLFRNLRGLYDSIAFGCFYSLFYILP